MPSHTFERRQLEGTTAEALTALGLPQAVCSEWARFTEPLERSVVIARDGARVAGAALVVRRRLGQYVRLAGVWMAGAADTPAPAARAQDSPGPAYSPAMAAVRQELLAQVEQQAWADGALVVKLEGDAGDDHPPGPAATGDLAARHDAGATGDLAAGHDAAATADGYAPVAIPPMPAPIPDVIAEVPGARFRWRTPRTPTAVPYVRQTSDFTCGAASLLMALAHFGLVASPDRATEFALWREATIVEACDPYGLALTAARRGLEVELTVTTDAFMLLEEFEDEQARGVRRFLQSQFRRDVADAGIGVRVRAFSAADVRAVLDSGRIAIVLIDEDPFGQGCCPHWIVVHGTVAGDAGYAFLVHDPWTGMTAGETWIDAYDLPLLPEALERLCAFGDPPYSALLSLAPAS